MEKLPIVISASRMTDMPAFYPQHIISEVEARKLRGLTIHTIALWTKHIDSVFKEPLHSYLAEQQKNETQLYINLTITGMGKDSFVMGSHSHKVFPEPCVPPMSHSLSLIDQLIDFMGSPERIRLRVDPLVRLRDAEGNIFSNYDKLFEITDILHPKGINHYSFSFLEKDIYKKIDTRFARYGIEILPPDASERQDWIAKVNRHSSAKKVIISACSVPGLPQSACIDGNLLQRLHPRQLPLDLSQPRSRELCGCTKSVDIGGWPPKTCFSGCIYCYARPKL
jgi:hypothetical protein